MHSLKRSQREPNVGINRYPSIAEYCTRSASILPKPFGTARASRATANVLHPLRRFEQRHAAWAARYREWNSGSGQRNQCS